AVFGLSRSARPAGAHVAGDRLCRGDEVRGCRLSVDRLRERDAWLHARDGDRAAAGRAVPRANRRAIIGGDSGLFRRTLSLTRELTIWTPPCLMSNTPVIWL